MIYVGIDAASNKHDVCIANQNGEIYKRIFTIRNTKNDYKRLENEIFEAKNFWNDFNVSIGIESTGVYSETLVNFLSANQDYNLIYINPVLTNMFQLSETIHYAKTDKIDASGICKYLMSKVSRLFTYTPPSYTIQEMKSLGRAMRVLNKQITNLLNNLNGKMHIVFPELFQVFDKVKTKSCLEFLIKFPTPDLIIRKRNLNEVLNQLERKSKQINLNELIPLAKETVGKYNSSDKISISFAAQQIKILYQQKELMVQRMQELVETNAPNLLTIPGMGANLACTIYGEIGNINNFHGSDSLVAFAGLNPFVYQSGKYEAKGLAMSKKDQVI